MCEESIKDKFLKAVQEQIPKTFGNSPKNSEFYSRMINTNHFKWVISTLFFINHLIFSRINNLLKSTKGKLIYKSNDENDHDDCYIGPYVFEVKPDDPLMEDEVNNFWKKA